MLKPLLKLYKINSYSITVDYFISSKQLQDAKVNLGQKELKVDIKLIIYIPLWNPVFICAMLEGKLLIVKTEV